jgi:hypothetical protein
MRIREKKYYRKMPMTTSSYIGGRANLYGIVARSVIHSSTTRPSAIVPGGLPPPGVLGFAQAVRQLSMICYTGIACAVIRRPHCTAFQHHFFLNVISAEVRLLLQY